METELSMRTVLPMGTESSINENDEPIIVGNGGNIIRRVSVCEGEGEFSNHDAF